MIRTSLQTKLILQPSRAHLSQSGDTTGLAALNSRQAENKNNFDTVLTYSGGQTQIILIAFSNSYSLRTLWIENFPPRVPSHAAGQRGSDDGSTICFKCHLEVYLISGKRSAWGKKEESESEKRGSLVEGVVVS